MLVIKIELWPGGDESRKVHKGTAIIANDVSGDLQTGNYNVRLMTWNDPPRIWKRGRVEGFPRLKLGPWDLLFRALQGTVGSRNRGS